MTVKNSVFYCSCNMFQRFGIPCRHILHVLDTFPKYKEPSINDVSVIYWKAYSQYCFNDKNDDEKSSKVGKLLANLRDNDILGPSCPRNFYKSIKICNELEDKFNPSRIECRNYDIGTLCALVNNAHNHSINGTLSV